MSRLSPCLGFLALALMVSLPLGACVSPGAVSTSAPSLGPAVPRSSSSAGTGSGNPSESTGFAFAAADVVAYYEGQGYQCTAERSSTKAVGFSVRTCQRVDDAGRTRLIGVVTAPSGSLANGYASVRGADAEAFLAPVDALEPLAGFLGAMLGADAGAALVPWLADHLGDAYAQTSSGPITVATFTRSEDDHSVLFIEVANRAYLDAPSVPGQ